MRGCIERMVSLLMKDYHAKDIRNVTLLGHNGCGKTSLIESMLAFSHTIDAQGSVDRGNTVCDFDSECINRKTSCYCAIAPIEWKDIKINFIDTPGYLDYAADRKAGLSVGDNVLIVVDGKQGIQSGTERAVADARQAHLPTIFFINKLDDPQADFNRTLESLRDTFGKSVIPFEVPIVENDKIVGSVNILRRKAWYYNDAETPHAVPEELAELVEDYYSQIAEAIAMSDDALMEKFFSGEEFSDEELVQGLSYGVAFGEIEPVFSGSALHQTGIYRLLDLIREYFPCYQELEEVEAFDSNGDIITLKTNEDEQFSAQIFKTIIDPFVGRISYLKVKTGVLSSGATVYNSSTDTKETIMQVYAVRGKVQMAVGKLFTGDIGVVTKLTNTFTNDTLCEVNKYVKYEPIQFPVPMLARAVAPKTKADEDKMSQALTKLVQEDKGLNFVINTETGQQLLYGVGEQHIDLVLSKLRSKFKVEVELSAPITQYRETITKTVTAQGKHKKQTGGAGQYGDVIVTFEPWDCEEMVFDEKVFGGAVPRQYFPAVEAGLRECMNKGVLAGYKVVGVKATLIDGSYHEVDSKDIAFKAAARLAYVNAMPQANPILLEPIGNVEVIIPERYTGDVIADLNKKRGMIVDMSTNDKGFTVVHAQVPMAEMNEYAIELRSIAQGRGDYTCVFDRYEPVPAFLQEKIVEKVKRDKD